jgi:hypothetical protein
MSDVMLNIRCAGMINGELVTVDGEGRGSVDDGTLAMKLDFSTIPDGFSIYCAALWTACCSTPTFAVERDGGLNMLSLSGGHYRCERTFDFGEHGTYDYSYELRLDRDSGQMQATGVIHGSLRLPRIVGVEDHFTEVMVPVGARDVRSFSATTFRADDGRRVPVTVTGQYSPLDDDDADWTCCARNQIRSSFIDIREVEGPSLGLQYTTLIDGIHAPNRPAALAGGAEAN